MSGDHHHHDHAEEDHAWTSFDEANGCAEGLQGTITGWNADAEARMVKAMVVVGKWVEREAGCLLGHIKAAIVDADGNGITLNLTDVESGVERHGELEPMEQVRFSFMSAVVDVEAHELRHRMFHAIDDTGLDYELDEPVECNCGHDHHHHHHHDGECCCGHHHDHDHDHGHHHHHHDDGECCCGHHHDHDEECHCHDHGHEHHHHDGECCCGHHHDHDHAEGHHHGDAKSKEEPEKKGSFLDRFRRKTK